VWAQFLKCWSGIKLRANHSQVILLHVQRKINSSIRLSLISSKRIRKRKFGLSGRFSISSITLRNTRFRYRNSANSSKKSGINTIRELIPSIISIMELRLCMAAICLSRRHQLLRYSKISMNLRWFSQVTNFFCCCWYNEILTFIIKACQKCAKLVDQSNN